MVTSNVRFKRIGLVIDSCQVSRVPWRTGLISGIVSASFFATPTTTPSFSVSSRTADCLPIGVEMLMFQVPVRDMCSSSRSLPRPSKVGVTCRNRRDRAPCGVFHFLPVSSGGWRLLLLRISGFPGFTSAERDVFESDVVFVARHHPLGADRNDHPALARARRRSQ